MLRPALRISSTTSLARLAPRLRPGRRFVSTAPPHQKSRSWKSSAARWGLAGALVYGYNTASVFAEEPAYVINPAPEPSRDAESYPTVASVSEQRRARPIAEPSPPSNDKPQTAAYEVADAERPAPGSPEELEAEAGEEGAFNEETGEINWDCPCLGGMAHGPCGEQFRQAFSCFVFSKEEPKGVDCIEHFKAMQNCFREHPDIYGGELDDDEPSSEEEEHDGVVHTEPTPATQPTQVKSSNADQSESAGDAFPTATATSPIDHKERLTEERGKANDS